MKGDTCFSRDPIRTVFKTVGSLLCWRLEIEWLNQQRFEGPIEEKSVVRILKTRSVLLLIASIYFQLVTFRC